MIYLFWIICPILFVSFMVLHPFMVVTLPASVREGINIFLDGHIPTENLRFRTESLQFRLADAADDLILDKSNSLEYPSLQNPRDFKLRVEAGDFTNSEILL